MWRTRLSLWTLIQNYWDSLQCTTEAWTCRGPCSLSFFKLFTIQSNSGCRQTLKLKNKKTSPKPIVKQSHCVGASLTQRFPAQLSQPEHTSPVCSAPGSLAWSTLFSGILVTWQRQWWLSWASIQRVVLWTPFHWLKETCRKAGELFGCEQNVLWSGPSLQTKSNTNKQNPFFSMWNYFMMGCQVSY